MVELAGIGSTITGYLQSGIFWLAIIIILFFIVVFFYIYMNRKSKLKYNCLELVQFGNGKLGMNQMKAGFFKAKTWLFGLIDHGNEMFIKTSDGRIIQQAKTSHLHDVFGRKGFVCIRSPKDPKVLIPISKFQFENMRALFEIAPADYRDASTRIFRDAVEETKGTWERILPYVMVALCVILTIIAVVINMQMTNHTTDKVGELLIEGCQNTLNVKPGTGA